MILYIKDDFSKSPHENIHCFGDLFLIFDLCQSQKISIKQKCRFLDISVGASTTSTLMVNNVMLDSNSKILPRSLL